MQGVTRGGDGVSYTEMSREGAGEAIVQGDMGSPVVRVAQDSIDLVRETGSIDSEYEGSPYPGPLQTPCEESPGEHVLRCPGGRG